MDRIPFQKLAAAASKRAVRGFSLVEILLTVAVIGIITAIAIPAIGNINATAAQVTAKDNAQNIVSVFTAGVTAGAPTFISCTSVREAQDAVGTGDHGAGTQSSTLFQLPGITQHADDAKPVDQRSGYYLDWQNGMLIYDQTGGHMN